MRIVRAPILVVKWCGVVVGVLGWILLVPLLDLLGSLARRMSALLPGRRPRAPSPPVDDRTPGDAAAGTSSAAPEPPLLPRVSERR